MANVNKDVENLKCLLTADGNGKWDICFEKQRFKILEKAKHS